MTQVSRTDTEGPVHCSVDCKLRTLAFNPGREAATSGTQLSASFQSERPRPGTLILHKRPKGHTDRNTPVTTEPERQRQAEFKTSLVYAVSSRIARATQSEPVLKTKQNNPPNQGPQHVKVLALQGQ